LKRVWLAVIVVTSLMNQISFTDTARLVGYVWNVRTSRKVVCVTDPHTR